MWCYVIIQKSVYILIALLHRIFKNIFHLRNAELVEFFGVNNDIKTYFIEQKLGIFRNYMSPKIFLLEYTFEMKRSLDEITRRINNLLRQHDILRLRISLDGNYIQPFNQHDYIKINCSKLTKQKIKHNIMLPFESPLISFFIYNNSNDEQNFKITILSSHFLLCARTFGMLISQLKNNIVFKTNYDDYFKFSKQYKNIPQTIVNNTDLLALPQTKIHMRDPIFRKCTSKTRLMSTTCLKEPEFFHILMQTIHDITGQSQGIVSKLVDVGLKNDLMDISNCLGNNIDNKLIRLSLLDRYDRKAYKTLSNTYIGRVHYLNNYAKIGINYRSNISKDLLKNFNFVEKDERVTWNYQDQLYISVINMDSIFIKFSYMPRYYESSTIDNFIALFKQNIQKFQNLSPNAC